MRRAIGLLGAVLIATGALSALATGQNTTFRISCSNFEGVRAQFAAHPASPTDQKDRLIKQEDAISGVRLELAVSTADDGGSVTTYGNVNIGGGVQTFPVSRVRGTEVLSFVGTDPKDNSTNLLTVFPKQARLLWTIHTDKIFVLDQIVLGKTFMGRCQLHKL